MTAPARIRQADMTRALKAAADAGCDVKRVEIDSSGTVRFYLVDDTELSPLEVWERAREAHRH